MNLDVLIVFGFGVAAGAIAVYIPWLHSAYRKYVVNCGKTQCPHHGPANRQHLNDQNERERNRKPPARP